MEEAPYYRQNKRWSHEMNLLFLQILTENKEKMRGLRTRKLLMQEIADRFAEAGYEIDAVSANKKWNNLLLTFKRCYFRRGGVPVRWEYYDQMKEIVLSLGLKTSNLKKIRRSVLNELFDDDIDLLYVDGSSYGSTACKSNNEEESDVWDEHLEVSENLSNALSRRDLADSNAVRLRLKELDISLQREKNEHLKSIADNLAAMRQNQSTIISLLREISCNVKLTM